MTTITTIYRESCKTELLINRIHALALKSEEQCTSQLYKNHSLFNCDLIKNLFYGKTLYGYLLTGILLFNFLDMYTFEP